MSGSSVAIDLVEAAYDLDAGHQEWLEGLSTSGAPLFDLGPGFYGAILGGRGPGGRLVVTRVHQGAGPPDFMRRVFEAAQVAGADAVHRWSKASLERGVVTISELKDEVPEGYAALMENSPGADGLSVLGVDPDGHGVSFQISSPTVFRLTDREKDRWRMLSVHMAAGHRLRRQLMPVDTAPGYMPSEFPLHSEALIDPTQFVVAEAAKGAQDEGARQTLRDAAIRVDRARGKLRKSDPEEALQLWQGLVRGRWSLVDWFDTDGRRFVLAKPNAPHLGDPRGLTDAEHQVATYGARGESGKLIGYRFGISQQRVSVLLKSAMKKLGVKTQAQLVEKMRGMPFGAAEGEVSE